MSSCHQHLQFPRWVRLFDIFVIGASLLVSHFLCVVFIVSFTIRLWSGDTHSLHAIVEWHFWQIISIASADSICLTDVPRICCNGSVVRKLKGYPNILFHFCVCGRIGENCCAPLRCAPNVSTQYELCGVTVANSFRHRTIPFAWIRLLNWKRLFDENKARKNQFEKSSSVFYVSLFECSSRTIIVLFRLGCDTVGAYRIFSIPTA